VGRRGVSRVLLVTVAAGALVCPVVVVESAQAASKGGAMSRLWKQRPGSSHHHGYVLLESAGDSSDEEPTVRGGRVRPGSPGRSGAISAPAAPVSSRPLPGGFRELKQLVQGTPRGTSFMVGPGEGAGDTDVFFFYRYTGKTLVGVWAPDGRREWFPDTETGWDKAGREFPSLGADHRVAIVGDRAVRAAFRQRRAVSPATAVSLTANHAEPDEAVYLYEGAANPRAAFKLVTRDGQLTLLRNDSGTWIKVANTLSEKGQTWFLLDQSLPSLPDLHAQLGPDPTG
jgi:hypothetical protein